MKKEDVTPGMTCLYRRGKTAQRVRVSRLSSSGTRAVVTAIGADGEPLYAALPIGVRIARLELEA
jgi:hypothetical protein